MAALFFLVVHKYCQANHGNADSKKCGSDCQLTWVSFGNRNMTASSSFYLPIVLILDLHCGINKNILKKQMLKKKIMDIEISDLTDITLQISSECFRLNNSGVDLIGQADEDCEIVKRVTME